uniref:Uncharacterized protein n=1 Tax=Anguilla anguilla TaxID=7936 RepID=A0A0E9X0W9_ANGAN
MDTDGSYFKKKGEKNRVKEAVCHWHGSRNNPSGPSKCTSPLPLGNVSSQKSLQLHYHSVPGGSFLTGDLVILTLRSAHA